MRVFAALLLAACGLACGDEALHGDIAFSGAERADVEFANLWIAEKVGAAPFAIEWDLTDRGECNHCIQRGPTWSRPGYHPGLSSRSHRRIALDMNLIGADLMIVAAHEFGHLHGLQHHEGSGIMNESPDRLEWTAKDEARR